MATTRIGELELEVYQNAHMAPVVVNHAKGIIPFESVLKVREQLGAAERDFLARFWMAWAQWLDADSLDDDNNRIVRYRAQEGAAKYRQAILRLYE
jgi:hypothetical protein